MELPRAFAERMKVLLGAEYTDFCHALEEESDIKGLRVNTAKVSVADFGAHAPFALSPVPYVEGGFVIDRDTGAGKHPYHHAGAYYLQDPGAMSAVAAIPPVLWEREGLRVLDLCAAPGGKTTQLAALCRTHGGAVLANEYVTARSRILAGNVERMGLDNVIVTNTDAARIASWYPDFFDVVAVDAPCSGEGMYRKNELAVSEWSPENVTMCAARQKEILESAARCVAPGGLLLYSTCTYSTEENEDTVAAFLEAFPMFHLIPVTPEVAAHTADGITDRGEALALCRRFYPHRCPGEGQFVALLQRDESGVRGSADLPVLSGLGREEGRAAEAFCKEVLGHVPSLPVMARGQTWLFPYAQGLHFPAPERAVAVGVPLGEIRKGRVVPHHHFFMAYGTQMQSKWILEPTDPMVARYLGGEELPCPVELSGYTAVLLACGNTAIPLGGGKAAQGRLKNYYPKGLRI